MNYHTCIVCGDEESYSTGAQCRNDVLADMRQQGWDVHDNDGSDEWYCPDCLDQMPSDDEEYSPPATVEYRGFTITFQKVFGDGNPKLRCQIREDEDFFRDIDLTNPRYRDLEKAVNNSVDFAKIKIDLLYIILDSTLDKFEKMLDKQVRRQMIDPRIVDKTTVFKTQMEIINRYFPK